MVTTAIRIMPTLSINSQGDAVTLLQKMLLYFGYLTCDRITGYYGSITDIAVRNFQTDQGLVSDGVVDYETWQSLIGKLPVPC
jgi:peptidoglycan hydrolase-like protein with peptidoglycan-binding domain